MTSKSYCPMSRLGRCHPLGRRRAPHQCGDAAQQGRADEAVADEPAAQPLDRLACIVQDLGVRRPDLDVHARPVRQFRGDKNDTPQLVGYATLDGEIKLIELPPDALGGLRNYVVGLAISNDRNTIAVSSPVGGTILTIDATSARAAPRVNPPPLFLYTHSSPRGQCRPRAGECPGAARDGW